MSKLHAAGLSDKSGSRAIQGVRSERYSFQRQLQIELAVIECAAAGQGIEVEFKAGSTLRELDTPECSN